MDAAEAIEVALVTVLGPGEMTGGADWSVDRAWRVDPEIFGVQLTGGFDELFLILDYGEIHLTARGVVEGEEWILADAGDVTERDLEHLFDPSRGRQPRDRYKPALDWDAALAEAGY